MSLVLPVTVAVAQIREMLREDHARYIALERDAEVKLFVGGPNQNADEKMKSDLERSTPSVHFMAIADFPSNVYIGRCGLMSHDPSESEMHCILAKPYWGRGIGKRVFRLLIQAAKEEGTKPVAIIDPQNLASRHVFEALGFVSEGPVVRDDSYQDGHLRYVEKSKQQTA
jgi:RimJ/RimL family protein N-acetyltransferase